MSATRRTHLAWLAAILFVAFALRIFRIENQSLWWDEGISLHLATSTWRGILADRVQNIHPPGYFFLLKLWVTLVGVTPFAARYLSALVSLMQVSAVCAIVRLFFGPKADRPALLAAVLVALSPLSIIYGQETRVYAFLPLFYFGLIAAAYRLISVKRPAWQQWALFGGIIWLGLHLHYITAFMVLTCGIWVLVARMQRRDWQQVQTMVVTAAAVLLVCLPWFVPVLINQLTMVSDTRSGTFLAEAVPISFLIQQIWLFHLTGLAGALQFAGLVWSGAAVAALFILLLVLSFGWRDRRSRTAVWFALWFGPLLAALYVWSIRSFSHPRYVSMFALGLLPLLAWLAARPLPTRQSVLSRLYRTVGVGLLAALFTASALALYHYYFNPAVEKDDMRGVARYLESVAQPDDLILIPDTDHSLRFEYTGSTPVVMPDLTRRGDLDIRFSDWMARANRVFVVDYERGTRDWQNYVHFALNNGGVRMAQTEFEDLRLAQYAVDRSFARPEPPPIYVPVQTEGGLALIGAWVEPEGNATGAVSVLLRWQIDAPLPHRIQGTLRLLGEERRLLYQQSIALIDPNGRPPDAWLPERVIETVHTLPLPEGTPPLPHVVTLELFVQSENESLETVPFLTPNPQTEIVLGETQLVRTDYVSPLQPRVIPHVTAPIQLDPALELVGYRLERETVLAGQTLGVDLLWRARQEELPLLEPTVVLLRNGEAIAAVSNGYVLDQHPTNEWEKGELVWERRAVVVPADVAGETTVILRLDENHTVLGTLRVEATPHLFAEPSFESAVDVTLGELARLVGADVGGRTEAGVPLRLVWQAVGQTADSYTLFVHLLDEDGRIVGQVDTIPQAGKRPTSGWVEGEYLVEEMTIPFNDLAFDALYQIAVGLYDPSTGTRLQTSGGEDRIILP